MSNTIFICYHPESGAAMAQVIADALKKEDYAVFLYGDLLTGGPFDRDTEEMIDQCSDFILILTPRALDRCANENDPIRSMLRRAFAKKKHVIPVRAERFVHPKTLPQDIRELDEYNAILFKVDFFDHVMRNITGRLIAKPTVVPPPKNLPPKERQIHLTVYSPVSTEVFLNDTEHPIMQIDCHTDRDSATCTVTVCGKFDLIFRAKGFLKKRSYDSATLITNFDVDLSKILHQSEIEGCYDRNEAREQLRRQPTAYAYQQLIAVGKAEDIDLLLEEMKKYMMIMDPDHLENYLIALCFVALGELAFRYKQPEKVRVLLDVYQFYGAKRSYGWMMEPIVEKLRAYGL